MRLPKDDRDRVKVLDLIRNASERHTNIYKTRWWIDHYWMLGYRNLYTNYEVGQVRATLYNRQKDDGQLELVYEDAVPKLQSEMGRLMRMDIRPATQKKGWGLNALRKAACGRVLLDHLTGKTNWDALKASLIYHATMFGTAGLGAWTKESRTLAPDEERTDTVALEPRAILEVIPPWQLLPVPHNPTSPTEVEGLIRRRWVPLEWLKRRKNLSFGSDEEMQVRRAAYGFKPDASSLVGISSIHMLPRDSWGDREDDRKGASAKSDTEYVQVEEWMLYKDEKDLLDSYTVKIGNHIALHEDYQKDTVYSPIGISRYHPIGGFFGRSFVEILIPINAAMERMAQNLFQNIEDLDLYSMLMVPQGLGISKSELLERKTKRKVIFYTPDLTLPESKIESVQPVNTGDTPGKTLAFANTLMDRLANQSELLKGDAPGRVDSQAGLSFLQETSAIPLSVPATSIAVGVSQVYKAILAQAPELLKDTGSIPLLGVDDSILGLKVLPGSGEIALDAENFPAPFEIEVDIRDKLPTLPTVYEQKLLKSLEVGMITQEEFRVEVWDKNLDFPVGRKADRESYRKALMQVVLLFNDGETPGQVIISTEADNPDIHLTVIGTFMAKMEYQFGSAQVKTAFEQLKQAYLGMKGGQYPQQLPYPEEAASMMGRPGTGGMGGMGGPSPMGRPM